LRRPVEPTTHKRHSNLRGDWQNASPVDEIKLDITPRSNCQVAMWFLAGLSKCFEVKLPVRMAFIIISAVYAIRLFRGKGGVLSMCVVFEGAVGLPPAHPRTRRPLRAQSQIDKGRCRENWCFALVDCRLCRELYPTRRYKPRPIRNIIYYIIEILPTTTGRVLIIGPFN